MCQDVLVLVSLALIFSMSCWQLCSGEGARDLSVSSSRSADAGNNVFSAPITQPMLFFKIRTFFFSFVLISNQFLSCLRPEEEMLIINFQLTVGCTETETKLNFHYLFWNYADTSGSRNNILKHHIKIATSIICFLNHHQFK